MSEVKKIDDERNLDLPSWLAGEQAMREKMIRALRRMRQSEGVLPEEGRRGYVRGRYEALREVEEKLKRGEV